MDRNLLCLLRFTWCWLFAGQGREIAFAAVIDNNDEPM
jgi:hypothetical protein